MDEKDKQEFLDRVKKQFWGMSEQDIDWDIIEIAFKIGYLKRVDEEKHG